MPPPHRHPSPQTAGQRGSVTDPSPSTSIRPNLVLARVFALFIALSIVVTGWLAPTSMVWPGSPGLSAPDAVPVAVSSDNADSINTSLHHVSPGHGRDPPTNIDRLIHTYYVIAGTTPVLVHNEDGGMVGANGTQITSSTLWLHGSYRIDVENPKPGVRPGQMHFQDQATGAKYIYNHDTGKFDGMPNSLQKELDKKMPDYKSAIVKGNRFLGMGGC